jgi:hypothetical protein
MLIAHNLLRETRDVLLAPARRPPVSGRNQRLWYLVLLHHLLPALAPKPQRLANFRFSGGRSGGGSGDGGGESNQDENQLERTHRANARLEASGRSESGRRLGPWQRPRLAPLARYSQRASCTIRPELDGPRPAVARRRAPPPPPPLVPGRPARLHLTLDTCAGLRREPAASSHTHAHSARITGGGLGPGCGGGQSLGPAGAGRSQSYFIDIDSGCGCDDNERARPSARCPNDAKRRPAPEQHRRRGGTGRDYATTIMITKMMMIIVVMMIIIMS